jgi:hypothetical protein
MSDNLKTSSKFEATFRKKAQLHAFSACARWSTAVNFKLRLPYPKVRDGARYVLDKV